MPYGFSQAGLGNAIGSVAKNLGWRYEEQERLKQQDFENQLKQQLQQAQIDNYRRLARGQDVDDATKLANMLAGKVVNSEQAGALTSANPAIGGLLTPEQQYTRLPSRSLGTIPDIIDQGAQEPTGRFTVEAPYSEKVRIAELREANRSKQFEENWHRREILAEQERNLRMAIAQLNEGIEKEQLKAEYARISIQRSQLDRQLTQDQQHNLQVEGSQSIAASKTDWLDQMLAGTMGVDRPTATPYRAPTGLAPTVPSTDIGTAINNIYNNRFGGR